MPSLFRNIQKRLEPTTRRQKQKAERRNEGKRHAQLKKQGLTMEKSRAPTRNRLEQAQVRARSGGKHATRELICAENGVKNTGRQWVKLRRKLSREDRARGLAR